ARTDIDRHSRAFVNQHVPSLCGEDGLLKLLLLALWRHLLTTGAAATAASSAKTTARHWRQRVRQRQQALFILSPSRSLEKCFHFQPRPKGPQASRCAFCNPHLESVSRVHSLARFAFGDAVRRGPITSLRYESVCITCEWFRPSSLIFVIIGSSAGCCGCCPNAA